MELTIHREGNVSSMYVATTHGLFVGFLVFSENDDDSDEDLSSVESVDVEPVSPLVDSVTEDSGDGVNS